MISTCGKNLRAFGGAHLGTLLACLAGCSTPDVQVVTGREPVVGGPCEGCEAVFEGRPADPPAVVRIAPVGEPGEPLVIEGRVVHADGTPAPGTIVYAYHTDARGLYPEDEALRGSAAYRHGTLRGWVAADREGRYRFETIRPAGYPTSDDPQHVHMHVIEPGRCTYYVDSIVFRDDPRLTAAMLAREASGRGASGVVTPRRDEDGTWHVVRDMVLGLEIPGHPGSR